MPSASADAESEVEESGRKWLASIVEQINDIIDIIDIIHNTSIYINTEYSYIMFYY